MLPARENSIEIEIGHVLYLDIVGFSKLLVDEQSACTARLNHVVRQTQPFSAAAEADKLFRLPTGDGMVLVFFTNPEAPVRCAIEIATALKKASPFGLRMGIHSGPVNKIFDVNDRANLAGSGINLAQRVMDCGDAGHILLSRRVAEDLAQSSQWQPLLHELGECEVKHGLRIHLVSLHNDEIGNAGIPGKVARAHEQQAGGIHSLAVKPLDNFSGDATKEYFADGMTDELITKLSQIVALKTVISRARMMKYKHSAKSCREIAFELNVEAVVQGSVVLAGDDARVTAQLIEAKTENTLWGESYTYNLANIIQLQNEVSLAIANAIALKLTPAEEARLTAERVVNPQAYKYYLRGKNWQLGDENTDARIDLLEKAVFLDNNFGEAYAELSDAYSSKAYFFTSGAKEWEIKAEAALERALEIDPNLPDAILARARFLWRPTTGFQHEKAIAEVKRALALIPNSSEILFFLAAIYFHVGLLDEAVTLFRRANEIDPDNPTIKFSIGTLHLVQGDYAQATAIIEANLTGMVRAWVEYNLISAYYFAGRIEEARARLKMAKAHFKDTGGILAAFQAFFLALDGAREEARAKIEEAARIGEGFGHYHHTTLLFAWTYVALGQLDLALKWLEYTADNGYPNLPWFERDPNLAKLRSHPPFVAFLDRLQPRLARLREIAASPDSVSIA